MPEKVTVPSPFGVYNNGEFTPFEGRETIETYFPDTIDPVTGYTVELALQERVGIMLEGLDPQDPLYRIVTEDIDHGLQYFDLIMSALAQHFELKWKED